jgi:hypothetical protein
VIGLAAPPRCFSRYLRWLAKSGMTSVESECAGRGMGGHTHSEV